MGFVCMACGSLRLSVAWVKWKDMKLPCRKKAVRQGEIG